MRTASGATSRLLSCQETGYSRSHISRIMQSPEFKERYRAARKVIEKEISRKYVERIASK